MVARQQPRLYLEDIFPFLFWRKVIGEIILRMKVMFFLNIWGEIIIFVAVKYWENNNICLYFSLKNNKIIFLNGGKYWLDFRREGIKRISKSKQTPMLDVKSFEENLKRFPNISYLACYGSYFLIFNLMSYSRSCLFVVLICYNLSVLLDSMSK